MKWMHIAPNSRIPVPYSMLPTYFYERELTIQGCYCFAWYILYPVFLTSESIGICSVPTLGFCPPPAERDLGNGIGVDEQALRSEDNLIWDSYRSYYSTPLILGVPEVITRE
jgi:hypothetical protein